MTNMPKFTEPPALQARGLRRWRWWLLVPLALLVAAGVYLLVNKPGAAQQGGSGKPGGPGAGARATPVAVAAAKTADVGVYLNGLGSVVPMYTVTIKSRVDGQLMQVSFTEGQEVKAGDPLFQIDPRPFQATLDQAIANKQRDEAQLVGAQADLDRYSKLVGQGFQSRQSVDQQKATVDALKGSIAADEAAIENARLNLQYADIRAPIAGRTGSRQVDPGNLVQVGQNTALVTITQIKPIFVNFTVPQDQTDAIRTSQAREPLTVVAYAGDDKTELSRGKVTLIENQIDAATGTLKLKGTFDNTDERLWPGEFVNVRLILATRKSAITVPQRTVMQGATDSYVYVVKADSTVERRTVRVAAMQDGVAAIDKGLAAGETIVVDGQYRLTNGAKVKVEKPKDPPGKPAEPLTAHSKE